MTKPKLYVFTISHYCEKACWALDYLSLDYDLVTLSPISHTNIGKKLGLKRGSVPFLHHADGVLQGSAAIIQWAEAKSKNGKSLASDQGIVNEIQTRLDDVLGVHVRRYFYSHTITDQPELVKHIFMHGLPLVERIKMHLAWNKVRQLMIKFMDLGQPQGQESLEILDAELDWLDGLLAESGRYLSGDEFTAADLSAASLLAPLVLPEQYPTTRLMTLPPSVESQIKLWQSRPVWTWVRELYAALR